MRGFTQLCIAAVLGVLGGASPVMGATLELIAIDEPDQVLNIENCQDGTFYFKVTFSHTSQYRYDTDAPYEVWLGRGSGCSPSDNDPANLDEVDCLESPDSCCEPLVRDGTVTIDETTGKLEVTLGPYELSDYVDCGSNEEDSLEIAVFTQPGLTYESITYQWIDTDEWQKKSVSVSFDLQRPDPPSMDELQPGETSVKVTWVPLSDETIRYRAYAAATDFDVTRSISAQESELEDLHQSKLTDEGASSATVEDLRTRQTYYVTVVSVDDHDNPSFPAASREVETVDVLDFYEAYRIEGGQDPGGYCSVARGHGLGGIGWLLIALVGLGLVRVRGRKRLLLGLVVVVAGLGARSAVALAESPRTTTISVGFGDYVPDIDSAFHGVGPYERYFGDRGIFLSRMDVGWHLFQGFGTLAAGLGGAFGSISDRAYVAGSDTRAVEETSIRLVPMSGFLSYSMDWFAREYSFPLVPFGTVGLDYTLWWVYDGSDEVSHTTDPKGDGKGGVRGYHWSLGVKFLLDSLAPHMAQSFDLDMGVNDSYLFGEYIVTTIDDFGDRKSIDLSSEYLQFGISFDF